MTWKGIWEAIASVFEDALFIPYNMIREMELSTWWGANFMSWIFLLIGSAAFIYWLLQLKNYDEDTEDHYTYEETPYK